MTDVKWCLLMLIKVNLPCASQEGVWEDEVELQLLLTVCGYFGEKRFFFFLFLHYKQIVLVDVKHNNIMFSY